MPKLNLTPAERKALRAHKVKIAEILDFAVDELALLLKVPEERAREIWALADFQRIPSVGIRFAEDLVFLGIYSVEALKGKKGPDLLNAYELKKGFRTDVCVEDQFWLAVDFADTGDTSKNWWDFTPRRKQFRLENGYPADRPEISWFELPEK